MPRVVLILPSSTYRAEDFLAAAAALGIELIVASDQRQTLSAAMGERALVVDPCRPQGTADTVAALHARFPVDAVLAVDDEGVVAAAEAAARLGLRHSRPEAVAVTRDKARMRAVLAAAGVVQPGYAVLSADGDAGEVARGLGFPVVLKPVGLSASRGVIRADDAGSAREAARRIRGIVARAGRDPSEPLLVERFVPGPEVAVDALVRDGSVRPLVVFDKPDPLDGPFFEETLYVTPSRLPGPALDSVEAELTRAVAALGLTEGVVHAELRVPEGRAHVIEVAARSIGGLCSRALRFGLGGAVGGAGPRAVTLEELILRNAVGMPLGGRDHRERAAAGVMMLPIPTAGRLVAVEGTDAARAVPFVTEVDITIPPGGEVVPLPEGDRYLGFVFARAKRPDQVEAALREAHRRLDIRIDPRTGQGTDPR